MPTSKAGRRYSWLDDTKTARLLLEKACKLNPAHAVAHWQLSDALRVLSYGRTPPFVNRALVEQSKEQWEARLGTATPRCEHCVGLCRPGIAQQTALDAEQ